MTNVYTKLIEAMATAGVAPAGELEAMADGKIHRYRVDGDKSGSLNGWYFLDYDGEHYYGAFGSWKQDSKHTFTSREENQLSEKQRFLIKRRIDERKRQRDAEIQKEQEEAALRAQKLYGTAKKLTSMGQHPYLKRKLIMPFMARQLFGALVLPVVNEDGQIQSVQFIDPNGDKKLLSGGKKKGNYIPVLIKFAPADRPIRIAIAEGFATAATMAREAPDIDMFIAAIDAGNLKAVALNMRRTYPDAELIIAADCDEIGLEKAKEASTAAVATVYCPQPPEGAAEGEISDYNDLYVYQVKTGKIPQPFEEEA